MGKTEDKLKGAPSMKVGLPKSPKTIQQSHKPVEELRQLLLNSLSPDGPVTIEELTHYIPWARWADLFMMLGELRAEGKIRYQQRGSDIEIWSYQNRGREGLCTRKGCQGGKKAFSGKVELKIGN